MDRRVFWLPRAGGAYVADGSKHSDWCIWRSTLGATFERLKLLDTHAGRTCCHRRLGRGRDRFISLRSGSLGSGCTVGSCNNRQRDRALVPILLAPISHFPLARTSEVCWFWRLPSSLSSPECV